MSAPAPTMFTPAADAMAAKLGLKPGKANLEAFAATLQELAAADARILAVTSDSRGSGKLGPFGTALPRQIVEVGIAERTHRCVVRRDEQFASDTGSVDHGDERDRKVVAQQFGESFVEHRHQSRGSMNRRMVPPHVRPTANASSSL